LVGGRRRKASNEGLQPLDYGRFEAITNARPVHVAANESRVFEHLQMLRDCGLSKRQFIHDVTAHARRQFREMADDADAGRVAQGSREESQFFVTGSYLLGRHDLVILS